MIYDVGDYIQIHPGGQSILLNQIGNEVSEAYEQAGHSKHAREIMRHLPEIGTLRGAKLRPKVNTAGNTALEVDYSKGVLW